jgi:hypothetical protein
MRLTGNKKDISYNKVMVNLCSSENYIWRYKDNIWNKQKMNIHQLITSNYLLIRLYHEIKA